MMDRVIYNWETISVTALPAGWRHVFRNGDGSLRTEPAPCLLLQQQVGYTKYEGGEAATYSWDDDEPRHTGVVFGLANGAAVYTDPGNPDHVGMLEPGRDLHEFSKELYAREDHEELYGEDEDEDDEP
jgi:hypothetical protein